MNPSKFLCSIGVSESEKDFASLMIGLSDWPVGPPWDKQLDKKGRHFYWNASLKVSSWIHPLTRTFKLIVDIYRDCKGSPEFVRDRFDVLKVRHTEDLSNWRKAFSSSKGRHFYYHIEKLITVWYDPVAELINEFLLLESAVCTIWAEFMLSKLRKVEAASGGQPINGSYSDELMELSHISQVLNYPLPYPWVLCTEQAVRFVNIVTGHVQTSHPLRSFYLELAETFIDEKLLISLLERESVKHADSERLVKLLAIRNVWLSSMSSPFPVTTEHIMRWDVIADHSEKRKSESSEIQKQTTADEVSKEPSIEVPAVLASTLGEPPSLGEPSTLGGPSIQLPEKCMESLILSSRVVLPPRSAPADLNKQSNVAESVFADHNVSTTEQERLETIGFMSRLFKRDLNRAFNILAENSDNISKKCFLKFFAFCRARPPLPASLMFDTLDVHHKGFLIQDDLVLAKASVISCCDEMIEHAVQESLRSIANQVALPTRPSTSARILSHRKYVK